MSDMPLQNADVGIRIYLKTIVAIFSSDSNLYEWMPKPRNLFEIMTMLNQELSGDNYSVAYDADTVTVKFRGQLVLRGYAEYAPIMQLLMEIAATEPTVMTLDLRDVIFLNSSGINMFSKFLLSLRNQENTQLVVIGTAEIPWQSKSLKNMPKLLSRIQLRLD